MMVAQSRSHDTLKTLVHDYWTCANEGARMRKKVMLDSDLFTGICQKVINNSKRHS